jgi:protein KTI12
MAEQTASGVVGGTITLTTSSESGESIKLVIELPSRHIGLPELQRHKRQFVNTHKKAVVLGSTEKGNVGYTAKSVAERFGEYLETHVQ